MTARLSSFLIWAVVAATVVAWGLRLGGRGQAVPSHALTALPAPQAAADLSRLFGMPPAQPVAPAAAPVAAPGRFRLVGVVAPQSGVHAGLALISVDGKPARAIGVGAELEPGLRVQRVDHRHVELGGTGAQAVVLELPPLPEPTRGRPGDVMAAAAPGGLPGMPAQPGVAGGLPLPFQPPGQAPAGQPQMQMQMQMQPQSGLNVPGTVVPQALMARPLPMPQMSNTMVAPAEMVDNGATNADAPTVAVPQAMR